MNDKALQTIYRRWAREFYPDSQRPVFVVSGAPGSGKSTYVRKNATDQDLILDMDALCCAIQGAASLHQDHSVVLPAALAAREAIYEEIENQTGEWKRAFIITANPDRQKVSELVRRFSAEHIEMKASREECKNRVVNDPARKGEEERQCQIVDNWFDNHT